MENYIIYSPIKQPAVIHVIDGKCVKPVIIVNNPETYKLIHQLDQPFIIITPKYIVRDFFTLGIRRQYLTTPVLKFAKYILDHIRIPIYTQSTQKLLSQGFQATTLIVQVLKSLNQKDIRRNITDLEQGNQQICSVRYRSGPEANSSQMVPHSPMANANDNITWQHREPCRLPDLPPCRGLRPTRRCSHTDIYPARSTRSVSSSPSPSPLRYHQHQASLKSSTCLELMPTCHPDGMVTWQPIQQRQPRPRSPSPSPTINAQFTTKWLREHHGAEYLHEYMADYKQSYPLTVSMGEERLFHLKKCITLHEMMYTKYWRESIFHVIVDPRNEPFPWLYFLRSTPLHHQRVDELLSIILADVIEMLLSHICKENE